MGQDAVVERRRAPGLDVVRVIGVVAIIAGHVWTVGTPNRLLYAWHVPVFLVLTGFLWTPGRTLTHEFWNRWRTLAVPYLSWLVMIGAVVALFPADGYMSLSRVVARMVLGGCWLIIPFTAFWFITVLFGVCLLRRALERFSLAAVTALAALLWCLASIDNDVIRRTPESLGLVAPALLFLVIGQWGARVRMQIPARTAVGAALVVVPLVAVATTDVAVLNMKNGDLGTPLLGLLIAASISYGLILLALELESAIPAAIGAAATRLATVAIMVILSHALVLHVLDTPDDGRWPDFAAAVLLPWALALVVARTPLAKLLIAWPRPAAAPARVSV